MTVYCDRLSVRTVGHLARARLRGQYRSGTKLYLLDRPGRGVALRVLSVVASALGFDVREAAFFAGHLRASSGVTVYLEAAHRAFRLAEAGADSVLRDSALLAGTNARWGRDTVKLRATKHLWASATAVWVRVLVAEALAGANTGPAALLISWPAALPRELVRALDTPLAVRTVGVTRPPWKFGRFSPVLLASRRAMRRLGGRLSGAGARAIPADPALLVLQEDNVSLDRSFRTQPHWMPAGPEFRTVILRTSKHFEVALTAEEASRARLQLIELADVPAIEVTSPLLDRLRGEFARLAVCAVVARHAESIAAAETARLMLAADDLVRTSIAYGAAAFLTCENYMLHADAMQLVAEELGVRTLSYQYSNLPAASLPMITTADELVTFSPLFHDRFTWPGYRPPAFTDAGYVYDSNFTMVAERARARRARLEAAGARFVIGFFDESVQDDKYGLVHRDEYEAELLLLLDLVQRDPSVGLVVKTQFRHNMKRASPRLQQAIAAAIETGRVELPSHGRHRNVVLPAEVAASADITIGHFFGATASLESALAGCRSLMVNTCGHWSRADHLYKSVDVLYMTLEDACDAIARLRAGDPACRALGDWSSILPHFDPYRDGDSAARLYAALRAAVLPPSRMRNSA
jgi:hypothetical protein